MDIERITEIGVAVRDLDEATRLFVDLLGATAEPVQVVEKTVDLHGNSFSGMVEGPVDLLLVELGAAEPIQVVDKYRMRYRMCRLGKVDFELMQPIADDGVIADFLRTRGPGLHHVAFAVRDVTAGAAALAAKGVRFVEPAPFRPRCSACCSSSSSTPRATRPAQAPEPPAADSPRSRSRSATRRILPVTVSGICSMKRISRGYSCPDRRSRTNAFSAATASSPASQPGAATT